MRTEIHEYFFLQHGEKALKGRASFAEFFRHENILKTVVDIQKIMLKRFGEIKGLWKGSNLSEFKSVDVAPVLQNCFDDVVNIVMFGEEDPAKIPRVQGDPLSVAIEHLIAQVWLLFKSPIHTLTLGVSTKLLLTKQAREYKRLYNDVVGVIKQMILDRERTGSKPKPNLIDMMIEWNKKCEAKGNLEDKYTLNTMIGLLIFFYSAGTDTSRASLTSLLYYLGEQSEARKLVEKDLKENLLGGKWANVNDSSNLNIDWDRCAILDQFIKEGQRMMGISIILFYRTCMKDHKLGNIKIKKGTILTYPTMFFHKNERFFSDPEKFDITRFEKEKAKLIPKRAFAPFGLGQRMCAGIELGYIMVKSAILGMLSQFEVEADPSFEPKWDGKFTVEMPSVVLRLRPRKD